MRPVPMERPPSGLPARTVRVVVVDDSRLMRALLQATLDEAADIAVVGTAADPLQAREVIRATDPDVVTLDVEMPGMDGLEFLDRIMALRPMPVVMVAGSTTAGAETTLAALEIGAVDFAAKPSGQEGWAAFAAALRDKVRAAADVRFAPPRQRRPLHGPVGAAERPDRDPVPSHIADRDAAAAAGARPAGATRGRGELIAIGASTGGVTAINRLLDNLGGTAPPVVITQHMPPGFTTRFAERLRRTTGLDVAEASDQEELRPGMVRVAPGDRHLRVARKGTRLICRLGDDPPLGSHRPAVDALFASVAEALGDRAVGVILTGMGNDGARGLLQMRAAGAATFGEAEISCTVYGMPKAAMRLGAVSEELDIDGLALRLFGGQTAVQRSARMSPSLMR